MAHPRKAKGFTLVELLVVITIIGMLVSLLLPAVQSARESGRRNTCLNNMRNCALALQNFEQNKKGFPGYANMINGYRTSWVVPILSYLERNDLYQNWLLPANKVQPTTVFANQLAVLLCPSNPADGGGDNNLSFVVNTGVASTANDNLLSTYSYQASQPNKGQNWAEDPNSGVFFNLTQTQAIPTNSNFSDYKLPGKRVTMDFLNTKDGSTYTLMLSENMQATNWCTDPTQTNIAGTGVPKVFQNDFQVRQNAGFVWFITNQASNVDPPTGSFTYNKDTKNINANAKTASGTPQLTYSSSSTGASGLAYARPSSNHPGGVNAFFCSGSGRFIAEDIGYHVYTQLMTSNQNSVKLAQTANPATPATAVPVWTYTLNEADF